MLSVRHLSKYQVSKESKVSDYPNIGVSKYQSINVSMYQIVNNNG